MSHVPLDSRRPSPTGPRALRPPGGRGEGAGARLLQWRTRHTHLLLALHPAAARRRPRDRSPPALAARFREPQAPSGGHPRPHRRGGTGAGASCARSGKQPFKFGAPCCAHRETEAHKGVRDSGSLGEARPRPGTEPGAPDAGPAPVCPLAMLGRPGQLRACRGDRRCGWACAAPSSGTVCPAQAKALSGCPQHPSKGLTLADILAGDTPMLLTVREWDQDRAPHQIRALPTLRPGP